MERSISGDEHHIRGWHQHHAFGHRQREVIMSKKKKGFKSPAKPPAAVGDINVTPLIDIVLVLLIIYMVVTPIMLNQMSAELPDSTETVEELDMPEEQLLV